MGDLFGYTRPRLVGLVSCRSRNEARYRGSGREWETPPEIFDPLNEEFNFTLDPCCRLETAKAPSFFTEIENGLRQSWQGHRVFMNPPYGAELSKWTNKARQEAAGDSVIVGLLPASVDNAWWHRDILGHAEIRYIRGRVRFKVGRQWASPFCAIVIVIWRSSTEWQTMWAKPFQEVM
jgi:site-specific DNA-methyltransferase (adenine-specific)